MITLIGYSFLLLALLACIIQTLSPALLRSRFAHATLRITCGSCYLHTFFTMAAFVTLIYAYIISDFGVMNVFLNSHSTKPLIYKITGTWGNHEGSILLWALILTIYAACFTRSRYFSAQNKIWTLAMHGFVCAGILLYIITASNPFIQIWPAPQEGKGLNPILQDIGLAIHPPMLYLGYVGFSLVFAIVLAGLITRDVNKNWASALRPWILLPWAFLTFGIGLGSWWAYRELGWGGWWFWDPVENVSLLPWFTGVALLHSVNAMAKRAHFFNWTVFLALLTFIMSLLGTFIVRSGLLTSVHSFATDPERGLFILVYIGVITIKALTIFALRPIQKLNNNTSYSIVSRESFLLINNLFMVTASISIFVAIIYPMLLELITGKVISVGAPYYNQTILPLLAPTVLLAVIAAFAPWQHATLSYLMKKLQSTIIITTLTAVATFAFLWHSDELLLTSAGIILASWLGIGSAAILLRARAQPAPLSQIIPMTMGHAGVALLTLGITINGLHSEQYERPITLNTPIVINDYHFIVHSAFQGQRDNYLYKQAQVNVAYKGSELTTLQPELRFYPERGIQTAETAIHTSLMQDIYVVIGTGLNENSTILRIHINKAMNIIWAGFVFIGLAAIVAALQSHRYTRHCY